MLCMMLTSSGYECESVGDGVGALDLIDRANPDVAILDVGLPDLDGVEVARSIRQNPAHDRMRLIALTGHGEESDRTRTQDAGFDAHLVKPVDFKRLLDLVARVERGAPQRR
jgi:two-component system CheB/CheR fusion protein